MNLVNKKRFLIEIAEYLETEFPKKWIDNFLISNVAAQSKDLFEKENEFISKIEGSRKYIFRLLNLFLLSGEYIYHDQVLDDLKKVESVFKNIETPQPQIEKIPDEIANHNEKIIEGFNENFFNLLSTVLSNEKPLLTLIYSHSRYGDQDTLFRIEEFNEEQDLSDEVPEFKFFMINNTVCFIDHFFDLQNRTLRELVNYHYTLQHKSFNSLKQEQYFILLTEKISFLIQKLLFRRSLDKKEDETPSWKEVFYLGSEEKTFNLDDYPVKFLTQWIDRFKNHYLTDETYFLNRQELESIKEKIYKKDIGNITLDEFHKGIKFFKDKEKSLANLEKLSEVYQMFYEETKNKDCDFDKTSLAIDLNYIKNNEFSLALDKGEDLDSIEKRLVLIQNIQDETGIRNFFPFYKLTLYLATIIDKLLEETKISSIESQIERMDSLVKKYQKYLAKWESNLKWCDQRDFLAFRLLKNDSTKNIKIHNESTSKDEEYMLFVASSFVLPFNYTKKTKELEEYKRKSVDFSSSTVFYRKTLNTISDIAKIQKDVESQKSDLKNQESRFIEILGVFSAIVIFASGSIQFFQKANGFGDALMFLGVFSISLVLFTVQIRSIINHKSKDGNFCFYKDSNFIVSGLTLLIIIAASFFVYRSRDNNEKLPCTAKCQVEKLPLDKAIVDPEMLKKLYDYEKDFTKNDTVRAPKGISWYKFLNGSSKVLILAPHATSQIRKGERKIADGGTGSLAIFLNEYSNTPVLFTTYLSPSDPNYYDDNAFKDTLRKIIKALNPEFVLDLHGSSPMRPYDIDFGTLGNKSFLNKKEIFLSLIGKMKKNGMSVSSQDYFSASKNQTDTKWVYEMNYPCVQMEINSNYLMRPTHGDTLSTIYSQKSAQLLQVLMNFIQELDKEK